MNKVVMVMVADRDTYTYCPNSLWTTRSLALEAARALLCEDWLLVELSLNAVDKGECIWSSHADGGAVESKFYLRFWPTGFPYK